MNTQRDNIAVFKEISGWKTEAKLENMQRYFYVTPEVKSLLSGDKFFVLGRKGTGKTAIAQFIDSKREFNSFTRKLSLKNFPFNSIYSMKDVNYTAPNQYITLWKFVIYSSLMYMLADNEAINSSFRNSIERVRSADPQKALSKSIQQWRATGFNFGFDKAVFGLSGQNTTSNVDLEWIDRVDIIKKLIMDHIDDSTYYLMFDELDEDYKHYSVLKGDPIYIDLITGLFKAVQDIRSDFNGTAAQVRPIVFLRDDIFDLIQDSDKTKWLDTSVALNWTSHTIQPLLSFRISRAFDERSASLSFTKTWDRIFAKESIGVGRNRQANFISIFDYFTRSTMLRPRDYIKFMQLCADHAFKASHTTIRSQAVTRQDETYSRYFRSEFTDEIHSVLPDILEIFGLISKIGKQEFSGDDFRKIYDSSQWPRKSQTLSYDQILRVLHYFSVIGMHGRQQNIIVYRYRSPEAQFDLSEKMVVHRGLHKSLTLL